MKRKKVRKQNYVFKIKYRVTLCGLENQILPRVEMKHLTFDVDAFACCLGDIYTSSCSKFII